jgi:hypothetical protein
MVRVVDVEPRENIIYTTVWLTGCRGKRELLP